MHQIIDTDYNNMNFDVIKGISTNIDDFPTELYQFSTNIDYVVIKTKNSTEHLDKIVHTFQTGPGH